MSVFPPKENSLGSIFGSEDKIVIGVIHSKPLPGSPRYQGERLDETYRFARGKRPSATRKAAYTASLSRITGTYRSPNLKTSGSKLPRQWRRW